MERCLKAWVCRMTFYDKLDFTIKFIDPNFEEIKRFFGTRSYFSLAFFAIKKSLEELKEEIERRKANHEILSQGGKELVTSKWIDQFRKRIALLQSGYQEKKADNAFPSTILENGRTFEKEVEMVIDIIQLFYKAF